MSSNPNDVNLLHNHVVESKRKWISEAPKAPDELPADRYIFCNSCHGETNHICKVDYCRHHLADAEKYLGGILYKTGYRLWMCAGCENCTLERYDSSELSDDEDGEYEVSSTFYPKRTEYGLARKIFRQLPHNVDIIYQEVIQAYNNELSLLCAVGVRALIESICADQNITGKNLKLKIDGLRSILPDNIVVNLHSLRFIGNEAVHELTAPPQPELELAIDICEDLLNFLYELDYKATALNEARVNRKSHET